jgi:dihydrofolate reductase
MRRGGTSKPVARVPDPLTNTAAARTSATRWGSLTARQRGYSGRHAKTHGGLSFVSGERELKEQSGKDIWLWGSLKLMHSLLDAGVVDEVRMLVCPASRRKGTRIFEDSQDLKLVEATPFENGVVVLRYEIKK